MKRITAGILGMVFLGVASAASADTSVKTQTCNGQLFSGDYIAKQYPSFAPLTVQNFNDAAGEVIVGAVTDSGLLLVTPADPNADCNIFMDKIMDTNLLEWVEPNYLLHHTNPEP